MKYLVLIAYPPDGWSRMTADEQAEAHNDHVRFHQTVGEHILSGDGDGDGSTSILRVRVAGRPVHHALMELSPPDLANSVTSFATLGAGFFTLLLTWLALEGPTRRERLAGLLWPDSPADSARNALRQRLFRLRKQCGTDLVSGT